MRFRALSTLLSLVFSLAPASLLAQVEPQLETKTDLLDVYRKDAGKPEMVVIYDFTTPSRGVYEAGSYLTGRTRSAWINGNQGQTNAYQTTFFDGGGGNSANFGKDFGMVFGMQANSATTSPVGSFFTATQLAANYPNLFALIGGNATTITLPAGYLTIPTIRMWRWPLTKQTFQQNNVDVVGVPLAYDSNSGRMLPVVWTATDTASSVIARITHVRFRIAGNGVTRSIDLPCPSRIFDNPAEESTKVPRTALYADDVKNYQKHSVGSGSDTIVYDPWSDSHLINTVTPAITQGNGANATTDTILGNFFYSYDYLAFIYGGKTVRNADSSDWTSPTASNAPFAEATTLYAVPQASATLNTSHPKLPVINSSTGEGWNNGLPVMTRYQAMKYVSANVMLDKDGTLNWIYRFLAPAYPSPYTSDDGDTPEELGGVATPPANDGNRNGTKLRYLRRLLVSDLKLSATSLQNLGPSNFGATTAGLTMNLSDNGNFKSVDPRTPQPWSYTLASTYYRLSVERPSLTSAGVLDEQNASCPGKTFVVPFPCVMMNDSQTSPLDQLAVANGVTYARTGSSGLNDGSYTSNAPVTSLVPGNERFFPGDLASTAAFRKSVSALDTFGANSGIWGTPWNIGTSPHQAKIQTMVVSAAIPGAYKFKSDNNGWNPHEWYFHVAAWANPYRTDMGYGRWVKSQGGTNDLPVTTAGGQVRYYASADPGQLEENWKDLSNYIVAARATLSAPATPSTGARTTTQAYFGIFKTKRTPIWSGNLFAVGIARTDVKDALGVTRETFTFYDANGEDTRPVVDATTTPITYGISDFDNHHLWSAYDIFGKYNKADIPFDRPVYPNGILGAPLLWTARKVYTVDPGGTANALVSFDSGNTTLTGNLQTYLGASATEVADFIDFIRGKNTNDSGATNRIDIMGDIVNSAPLAVELSKNRISGAMLGQWGTFEGAPDTWEDLHARVLMVGTNMGQFHCFGEVAATGKTDSSTSTVNPDGSVTTVVSRKGKVTAYATELWSFIPRDVLKKLYEVYVNRKTEDTYKHVYLVDGDPALYHKDLPSGTSLRGDTRVSDKEDAVIIFGERKGGRSYWALAISGGSMNGGATPDSPLVAWSLQPLIDTDPAIKTMGMSSSLPTFAVVKNGATDLKGTPAVFLGGGYANNEVNARYRASGNISTAQGMGQLVLALNPLDGSKLNLWDFKDDTEAGSIGGGVTPVQMFLGDEQSQRIYWADYKGNIRVAGTNQNTGAATNFRLDYSNIQSWKNLRYIRRASKNTTVPQQRFTNKPEAFKLANGFPVYVTESDGKSLRPVTVMVSAGAGDRNNPTDADESMSIGGYSAPAAPPATDRLYVLADRQDSAALGIDDNGILDADLQLVDDNTSGTATWATSYTDARLNSADSSYLWKNHNGYYFSLLNGTLPSAYNGVTHDKLLVAPLAKEGALFFSLFNISGNSGFDCSSNQFTRTFRECDILRPLAVQTQWIPDPSNPTKGTVGNTDDATRNVDNCNGLAFYFNSLSSQLTDAGDRVVQGGAISSKKDEFNAQTGENTPDIKAVKDTTKKRGFRLRSWRVVR